MEPVPRDGRTIGEVVMRGNVVMLWYYKDPEATKKAFQGGWFHSGDLSVMHPDNHLQSNPPIIVAGRRPIPTIVA
jgi:fatty-acyl-CoA synthase